MPKRLRFTGLWRHPDFLRFWAGQTLSVFGAHVGTVAYPLVAILTLEASAAQVGLLVGLGGLPWLLFGSVVGVGIDRLPRRPILIAADLGRGALLASVAVAALLGVLRIEQLYAVAFLGGIMTVCFETAYQSYLPSLVEPEHLVEANGKLAISESASGIAGPGLAGVAIQIFTAPVAVAFDALSFFASALCLGLIRRPEPPPPPEAKDPIWPSLRAGFAFLWRQPLVRAFAASNATFMFFFTVTQTVLLLFFVRYLHLTPAAIGIVFAAGNVGALLGAAFADRIGERLAPGQTILGSSALRAGGGACVPLGAIVPALAVPMLVAAQVIQAFGWSVWAVHQGSTRQLLIPNRLRGRVNASFLVLVRGGTALGGLAGGALAGGIGVMPTLVIGTVGSLLGTAWLIASPLPRLRARPAPADDVARDAIA